MAGVCPWGSVLAWAILAATATGPKAFGIDTIEAAVADSDAVVVATLGQLTHDPPEQIAGKARASLTVREVIKGQAGGEVPLILPTFYVRSFVEWRRQGGQRLVFLIRAGRAAWHPQDARYPLALRAPGWTLRPPFGDGLQPGMAPPGGSPQSSAEAAERPLALTVDLRTIATFEDACAAAREAATWPGPPAKGFALLLLPAESELRRRWKFLEHEALRIPLDERAERAAQSWAPDAAYAAQVAMVLSEFPSDRNAAILTGLLADSRNIASGRPGKSVTWSYPVRGQARRALEQWGRAPRNARTNGPRDFYWLIHLWHVGLVVAGIGALAGVGIIATRRRGVRLPVVSILLAALCIALIYVAVVSRHVVHELTASAGDSRYWVSFYRGGLQLVRIKDWPGRQPLSYGRFDLATAPDSLWNEKDVYISDDDRVAGFRKLSGTMSGDARGATYPYGSVTVPTAFLAALAALWPGWCGLARVRDRARRRARVARGWCAACGYNLHGTADRCPECGEARPAAPV